MPATHPVCKMLAFTIQFPNNNPTPPHHNPTNQQPTPTQNESQPSAPGPRAADTGQTPKHQAPTTTRNHTHQHSHPTKGHEHQQEQSRTGQEACCLKTQQCTKQPSQHHTSHDPFQHTPPTRRARVLNATTNTAPTMPTPPHPNTSHHTATSPRTCFSRR